jgi:hypothetical protein
MSIQRVCAAKCFLAMLIIMGMLFIYPKNEVACMQSNTLGIFFALDRLRKGGRTSSIILSSSVWLNSMVMEAYVCIMPWRYPAYCVCNSG